jgi:fructose-1-phosphate kinase PfkB-like protein
MGKTVVLDASGPALVEGVAASPDIIKPNRHEFEDLLGRNVGSREEVVRELRHMTGEREVVLFTDGARGAYAAAGREVFFAAAPDVKVVDSTGAGDSFLGQFCAGYFTGGRTLTPELVAAAVAAGAASVELHGTPVPSPARIRELRAGVRVTRLQPDQTDV